MPYASPFYTHDSEVKKRVEKILMEFSTKGLTTPITEKKYKKTKTEKA